MMRIKLSLLTVVITLFVFSCSEDHGDIVPTDPDNDVSDDKDPSSDNGLPVIVIHTENKQGIYSKENYIKGSVQIIGSDQYDDINAKIKIRGRGNTTWQNPKKPYQIKLEDKQEVLGMPKDKKWILLANYFDKTMLRNETAFDISRQSCLEWTPESRFVELYINDLYTGTYQITQKVEESDNRVDIGKKGFLIEVDKSDKIHDDDVYFTTRFDRMLFNIKEPEVKEGDEDFNFIKNHIKTFEDVLFGEGFKDPEKGYASYIDVESFVDWYWINEITKNEDAKFKTSVYLTYIPGEKIKMGPVWDFDIGLGNIPNSQKLTSGFWIQKAEWYTRLFQDPAFSAKVRERFAYFYNEKDKVFDKIKANADYIYDSQIVNHEKWGTLQKKLWPNPHIYDTYEEELGYLKSWLEARYEWLNIAVKDM
jgi:hypothetical protein